MMLLKARAKPSTARETSRSDSAVSRPPSLEQLVKARDYEGAIALLESSSSSVNAEDVDAVRQQQEWLAYAHFHNGECEKALEIYRALLAQVDPDPQHHTYAAACLYHMGLLAEAEDEAAHGPRCALAARVLFHCAAARHDDSQLLTQHSQLGDGLEDRLSLAALHYARGHYQEAADIYKSSLLAQRDLVALNVCVALCYARLDYFDVSQDVLQAYLAMDPTSPTALNLRACNAFRLSSGRAAEAELQPLIDALGGGGSARLEAYPNDLIRHNLVVFRGGQGSLTVFPALGAAPPEARLNLAIHHLRAGRLGDAASTLQDVQPATPHEYILKGVVALLQGQAAPAASHAATQALAQAQRYFHTVGSSASECDTIPGRQAMATALLLAGQAQDALVFLQSIASFFTGDDTFSINLGLALAAAGRHAEAVDSLLSVTSAVLRGDPMLLAWLARSHVRAGQPAAAWALCSDAVNRSGGGTNDTSALLRLVGEECYRSGAFLHALRAFHELEVCMGSCADLYEAKRGAAAGVFQAVVAGKEHPEALSEAVRLLRASATAGCSGSNGAALAQQVDHMARVIEQWVQSNGLTLL